LELVQRHLESIPFENTEEIHNKLSAMFGPEGAGILERTIITELFRRLNASYQEKEPFEFETCWSHAKEVITLKIERIAHTRDQEKPSHPIPQKTRDLSILSTT